MFMRLGRVQPYAPGLFRAVIGFLLTEVRPTAASPRTGTPVTVVTRRSGCA